MLWQISQQNRRKRGLALRVAAENMKVCPFLVRCAQVSFAERVTSHAGGPLAESPEVATSKFSGMYLAEIDRSYADV